MLDPLEGLDAAGRIRTGAHRDRIDGRYRALLSSTIEAIVDRSPNAAVYLYGSVATGRAVSPGSDVDVLTIDLDPSDAARIGEQRSLASRELCRAVEIAASSASDLVGDSDAAHGARVFLHHYCVHLAGPDHDRATGPFPGDRRAARGFNGDIAQHLETWRRVVDGSDPVALGRRIGRKTLLAVAGLVSIRHGTWTTDRTRAARWWSEDHPDLSDGLRELQAWATTDSVADVASIRRALDRVVVDVVRQFEDEIGLWDPARPSGRHAR